MSNSPTTPIEAQLDEIVFRCFAQGQYWGKDCDPNYKPHEPIDRDEAVKALIDLFAHLASEARPEKIEHHDLNPRPHNSEDWILGRDGAIDTYHTNLMKLIGRTE